MNHHDRMNHLRNILAKAPGHKAEFQQNKRTGDVRRAPAQQVSHYNPYLTFNWTPKLRDPEFWTDIVELVQSWDDPICTAYLGTHAERMIGLPQLVAETERLREQERPKVRREIRELVRWDVGPVLRMKRPDMPTHEPWDYSKPIPPPTTIIPVYTYDVDMDTRRLAGYRRAKKAGDWVFRATEKHHDWIAPYIQDKARMARAVAWCLGAEKWGDVHGPAVGYRLLSTWVKDEGEWTPCPTYERLPCCEMLGEPPARQVRRPDEWPMSDHCGGSRHIAYRFNVPMRDLDAQVQNCRQIAKMLGDGADLSMGERYERTKTVTKVRDGLNKAMGIDMEAAQMMALAALAPPKKGGA